MGLKSQANTKPAGPRRQRRMLGCRRRRLGRHRRKRSAVANDGRRVRRGERVQGRRLHLSPQCLLANDEISVAERGFYIGDNIVATVAAIAAANSRDQKTLRYRSSIAPALCSVMRRHYSVRSRHN